MKNLCIVLVLLVTTTQLVNAQSFQRMAIAKGSYKLSAGGSSKVTAYCLDYSRKAPKGGMDYGNILSGGSQAVVEISSSSGVKKMSLNDAVENGYVGIEGANALDGKGKDILSEIVKNAKSSGRNADEFEAVLDDWDNMSRLEKSRIESELAQAMGLADEGSHSSMKFVNKTDDNIEIKLENNLQLGSGTETTALRGIDNLPLSSSASRQDDIQREIVWAKRESQNLEKLKQLGFYDGNTNVTKYDFEDTKKIYKDFQKKHGIRTSGEDFGVFDEATELRVDRELKKLGDELQEIGFKGDLETSIKSYQKFKGIRETGNFTPSLRRSLKADIDEGIYISNKGKVYNTTRMKTSNSNERFFIVKNNVFVKFKNKNSIDNIEQKLNSRKYLTEEVEVISLVKDATTNDVLKKNFPKNHMVFDIPSMRGLVQKLKQNKKKSVVVVGHIEGDKFVTPLANGKTYEISLADLRRLGKELDVNIFPMGCNSGASGTGLGNKFNSVDALNRLKPAVNNNNTVMGMLEDLAGPDLKVIIDDVPFQDRGYLQAKIQKQRTQAGVATLVGTGTAGLIIYSSTSGDDEEEEEE